MRIRTTIAAAAIGALTVGGAVPAAASTDAAACRIMGPYYVEGVVGCVCLVAQMVDDTVLPDQQWVCDA